MTAHNGDRGIVASVVDERRVDADHEPELAVGQPMADAIGVARGPVDRMLGHGPALGRPLLPRRVHATQPVARWPAPRRRPRRTGRRPASGPGARRGGRRRGPPRGRTAGPRALARPASVARNDPRTASTTHGQPVRAGDQEGRAGDQPQPPDDAPRTGAAAPAGAAGHEARGERGLERQEGERRTRPRPGQPPSIAPSSQEPDRRAGRDGANRLHDVTVRRRDADRQSPFRPIDPRRSDHRQDKTAPDRPGVVPARTVEHGRCA